MKWHLVHRHEIPNAFDALGKDYETKTTKLLEANALLEKKVHLLEEELKMTEIKLIKEQGKNCWDPSKLKSLIKICRKWR